MCVCVCIKYVATIFFWWCVVVTMYIWFVLVTVFGYDDDGGCVARAGKVAKTVPRTCMSVFIYVLIEYA